MKLPIFNIVSAVSLILLIGVLVLWIRSYGTADYFAYCSESTEIGAISTVGRIVVYRESAIAPFQWKAPFGFQYAARPAPSSIAAYALPNSSRQVSWMGFGIISGDNGRYLASARFVPHWIVALIASLLPMLWLQTRFGRLDRGFQIGSETEGVAEKTLQSRELRI